MGCPGLFQRIDGFKPASKDSSPREWYSCLTNSLFHHDSISWHVIIYSIDNNSDWPQRAKRKGIQGCFGNGCRGAVLVRLNASCRRQRTSSDESLVIVVYMRICAAQDSLKKWFVVAFVRH